MAYLEDLSGYDEKFREFKGKIQDLVPSLKNDYLREDMNLLKFLAARDFDISKAEELFRKHMEWRREKKVDQILTLRVPSIIYDSFPYFYSGVDKRGHPILIDPVGRWKIRRIFKKDYEEPLRDFVRQTCEILLEVCRHLTQNGDKPMYQYTAIFDMEGFDYTQLMSSEVVRVSKDIVQEYFDNYPELPCIIRVVNAPKLFQLVWAVVEPLLTGRTISKIEVYGTNKEDWKPKLLQYIDPDNLPSRFGGAMTTCHDYNVDDGVNAFPRIVILREEDFQEVSIPAGRKHRVSFQLNAGDELAWNFGTTDYDIGFQVDLEGEKEPFVSYCRVDSHKFIQKGHFVCTNKGQYSLVFDNSYSKLKSKSLRYAVQLTRQSDKTKQGVKPAVKMIDRSPA